MHSLDALLECTISEYLNQVTCSLGRLGRDHFATATFILHEINLSPPSFWTSMLSGNDLVLEFFSKRLILSIKKIARALWEMLNFD